MAGSGVLRTASADAHPSQTVRVPLAKSDFGSGAHLRAAQTPGERFRTAQDRVGGVCPAARSSGTHLPRRTMAGRPAAASTPLGLGSPGSSPPAQFPTRLLSAQTLSRLLLHRIRELEAIRSGSERGAGGAG